MNPLGLIALATITIAGSGAGALAFARDPARATLVSSLGAAFGGALGLYAACVALGVSNASEQTLVWRVPGGSFVIGVDPLSACFLVPLFALGALAAVYGRCYLGARVLPAAAFNLLIATIALVIVARHALVFLVAWEAMTLLAFLLITLDHGDAEVRRAGWVYLIASHVAFLALLALFGMLGARAGGGLGFAAFAAERQASDVGHGVIACLALLGFGIKAGALGLHVWLPEAHAAAPSHVSALMSGVQIKLGLYGLLRMSLLVAPGAWFGIALMSLGVGGAVLGIALALQQRDLKRLLAYSSVENVGIILIGLGLGLWARERQDETVASLAFAGALLHLWNHAAMKGLLFLGSGSILHAAGTKDIEKLGGLLRRMPWTGRAMLLGAVAIAGLPPLNGLTGEWLLYTALSRVAVEASAPANLAAAGGAAALALVGGLASLCFIRLVGVVLLGSARAEGSARAHESPAPMTVPIAVLAVVCVAAAVAFPVLVVAQAAVLEQLAGASRARTAAAASAGLPLVVANAVLFGTIAVGLVWIRRRVRRAELVDTWGCGYAAPTARMQYTGSSFAELFTSRALPPWLRPPLEVRRPAGTWPASAAFATQPSDPITRRVYEPALIRWGDRFARLRFLQQGNVHIYLLYIVATAVGGLVWVAVREGVAP